MNDRAVEVYQKEVARAQWKGNLHEGWEKAVKAGDEMSSRSKVEKVLFGWEARAKITWKRLSNRRPTKGLDRAPHSKANSNPSWNDRDLEVFKTGLVSFAARRQGRMEPWARFSRFLLPAFNLIFTLLGCQVSKPGSYRKSLAPSSASFNSRERKSVFRRH